MNIPTAGNLIASPASLRPFSLNKNVVKWEVKMEQVSPLKNASPHFVVSPVNLPGKSGGVFQKLRFQKRELKVEPLVPFSITG